MTPKIRQWLTAALVLAIILAVVWDRIPLADAQARISQIPLNGFGFSGRDLPLNEVEQRAFGAAKVTKRLYQLGKEQYVVVVIDGTINRHAIHDPTYCFRGAGWTIASQTPLALPGGEASQLSLVRNGEEQKAMFWITDGQSRYTSPTQYWRQTALRRLSLGQSGPEPVLVMVQPNHRGGRDLSEMPDRLPALFEL